MNTQRATVVGEAILCLPLSQPFEGFWSRLNACICNGLWAFEDTDYHSLIPLSRALCSEFKGSTWDVEGLEAEVLSSGIEGSHHLGCAVVVEDFVDEMRDILGGDN